jgi:hypothetical protein
LARSRALSAVAFGLSLLMVGGTSQAIVSSLEDTLGDTVANAVHTKVIKRRPLNSLQRGLNPLQADEVSAADLPLPSVFATFETHPYAPLGRSVYAPPFPERDSSAQGPSCCAGKDRYSMVDGGYRVGEAPRSPMVTRGYYSPLAAFASMVSCIAELYSVTSA